MSDKGADMLIPGISAGLGVLEAGIGLFKSGKANKMRKKAQSFFEQNQYEIPESAKSALSLAERNAGSINLPGEDLARARIGETTARGVSASKTAGTSASDILTQMASLYGNEQRQETNLGLQGAQRYDQNQRYLGQALNNMANYETQKWQYNVLYPYQQMMGAAGQVEGVGNQMIGQGVGQIGMAGAAYGQMKAMDGELEAIRAGMGLGGDNGGYAYQPKAAAYFNSDRGLEGMHPDLKIPMNLPLGQSLSIPFESARGGTFNQAMGTRTYRSHYLGE